MNFNLSSPFYEHAQTHLRNLAMRVSGRSYSYGELAALACSAAAALGAAFIPLIPTKLPDERLASILEIIQPDALVVDEAGLARLIPALRAIVPTDPRSLRRT
jgi:hypothetical protein